MAIAPAHRIPIGIHSSLIDPQSEVLLQEIETFLGIAVERLRIVKVYHIYKPLSLQQLQDIIAHVLLDPIIEEICTSENDFDWSLEIGLKRDCTDNLGLTAQLSIEDYLGTFFQPEERVASARCYLLKGNLSRSDVERMGTQLLANPLIEEIRIEEMTNAFNSFSKSNVSSHISKEKCIPKQLEKSVFDKEAAHICTLERATIVHAQGASSEAQMCSEADAIKNRFFKLFRYIATIDLAGDKNKLLLISRERNLALNAEEMEAIRIYFQNEQVLVKRKEYGISAMPTDVEIEAIAQTWSEHCKHKIFNAQIAYSEDGRGVEISSIYKTYIKAATEQLQHNIDWLVSVFKDNAGVIRFNEKMHLACKVETHNSPSALDPYGGALTGILGVNRDILGTGSGAEPIANMNVLCFAPPRYEKPIPEKCIHPKRMLLGVCKGIEHGGNKSGIPTVNGSIVFDDRFIGKPLVYCGTIGLISTDQEIEKTIIPGDWIAIAGGKTGRDGIHGATFSSEELHENSPTSAVQIGDAFTQKKLHDFILEAQKKGLFRTLTDNGAGGLSSSVGEMALLSGGCEIDLKQVPLKDGTLQPWEILVSESQERMTLAVPFDCKEELERLAVFYEISIAFIGKFSDSGFFHVLLDEETIAFLSLDFMHHAVPQLKLKAEWKTPIEKDITLKSEKDTDLTVELHHMLSRYNICSKESIVRRYDHEVQGASCLKPFVGKEADGPSDASILFPIAFREEEAGIVVSNGICPRYSDIDTDAMAAYALNEAICNQICVGADPSRIAILDNFCWPDPIYDPEKNPDGKHKLAQLVRAAAALYRGAVALETPIISGKDSMKNDYRVKEQKISVPPTLLITAIGKIPCIYKAVSMDVKEPGDLVYIAGWTRKELGGSEYFAMKQEKGGYVPRIDFTASKALFHALFTAIQEEAIASCHDLSEGGLGVALAESAFAGGRGLDVDLKKVAVQGHPLTDAEILFSESSPRFVVTIDPKRKEIFEKHMYGLPCHYIGEVREDQRLIISGLSGKTVISEEISALKTSWKQPLRNV